MNAESSTEREILEVQEAMRQALLRGDADAVDELWADEFQGITTIGAFWPKHRALEELRSGEVDYVSLEYDELAVTAYGDTAVLTGRVLAQGAWQQRTFTSVPSRFTHVFVKQDGRWRLVAQQLTKITAP